jgi:hypothetical protein
MTTMSERDLFLTLNPVMLSKQEVNGLKDLLNKVKEETMTEIELCEDCGDTIDDCLDAGECNYGIANDNCASCNGRCMCDALYEDYKERQVADYFDSL